MGRTEWTPSRPDTTDLEGRITKVLDDPETPGRLAEYFSPEGRWAGGWFNRLGEFEHGPEDIGCHDLLSVTLMDVRVPPFAARTLLFDKDARRDVSALLTQIPTDVDIWDATDGHLFAANRLWNYFGSDPRFKGMGETSQTIRSKVIARKRPRLIPITDDVVGGYLGEQDLWSGLRGALRRGGPLLPVLESLAVGMPSPPPSLLRVLDASIWLHESKQASKR